MALPDHFEGEDVIITLEESGAATVNNVEGRVMSWNVSGGGASTDEVFAFGSKTFNFQKPREKFTVSFEVMINDTNFDFAQFNSDTSGATWGSMTGRVVKSSEVPSLWRIIFWFQSAASHLAGTAPVVVPAITASIYRMIFVDCKAVTFDKEFSADEYMKGTLTFEFSAVDSDGYANYIADEGVGIGTAAGTTLATMTTSTGKGLKTEARGSLTWSATTTRSWTGAYST